MTDKTTLSPNEFKALYQDPFIESITLKRKQSGAYIPVVFAEIVDITGDLVLYYYHEGFKQWWLVGVEVGE